MATRLLALDLATTLGWASGDMLTGDPVSGIYRLPRTGDDVGPFLAAYVAWFKTKVGEQRPDWVLIEAPILPREQTQLATVIKLVNLTGRTEELCYYLGIPIRQVQSGAWKKGFTGRGNASKSMSPYPVLTRCHDLGWEYVKDNNEADALGIWVHGVQSLAPDAAFRFDPLGRSLV
jgi:Holliday junction resolvasome RuvABC endonuclease subunit